MTIPDNDILMNLLEVFAVLVLSLCVFGGVSTILLAFFYTLQEFAENLKIEREERKTNPKEYKDNGPPPQITY